jgi:hypothetical protein
LVRAERRVAQTSAKGCLRHAQATLRSIRAAAFRWRSIAINDFQQPLDSLGEFSLWRDQAKN